MKILLKDELLEFSDDDLNYMYLGEGEEAEVYKYGREVLKIYKKYCRKNRLGEDASVFLSQIETKRFLLPKKIIHDPVDGSFIGYSMPFKYSYPSLVIVRLKMISFLDELDIIRDDIRILSNEYVDIDDLNMDNVLYDGSLFMGDPGSFEFRCDYPSSLYKKNIRILNSFVKDDVFGLINLSKDRRREVSYMFDDDVYIGEQIRDEVKPKETVAQFVKRISR